ncbi:MAG TPA: 30S ribosomal protein S9 [Actinomycetota bacterium]|jgi:small subunit ribosomal protein S9|nr:30S ribosomal protein S9 [Actinomycetota bacterium]
MPTKELARATGRRKEAVARVRLIPGEGNFVINGSRSLPDYFPNLAVRRVILEPLEILELTKNYDILATIEGGGTAGQAGALRHGISRALIALDPELRPALKKAGFLTRDSRIIERKKYGLKKARKAPQYSKR